MSICEECGRPKTLRYHSEGKYPDIARGEYWYCDPEKQSRIEKAEEKSK